MSYSDLRGLVSGVLVVALGAITLNGGASAAEEVPAPNGVLDVIIVQARKHSENIQTVPVAVTALDAAALESRFTVQLSDVGKYAPNVSLNTMPFVGGGMTASIRGIGFADLEKTFEPAVGVVVDGVYLANNTGAMVDAFDLASVEILRGPQGTLFGRNTIGGAISVERTRPTGDFGIKAGVTVGSFDRNDYKLLFNAPIISDKVALKIGAYSENSKSFETFVGTGQRDPGIDKKSATVALLVTPWTNFEALLTYDYLDDTSHYPKEAGLTAPDGAFCAGFAAACKTNSGDVMAASGYRISLTSAPFYAPLRSNAETLKLLWKFDALDLTAITGNVSSHDALSEENTGSGDIVLAPGTPAVPLLVAQRQQEQKTFSQEVRVNSRFSGPFDFVGGIYYFHSSYDLNPQQLYLLDGLIQDFSAGQTTRSIAAFAETYYKLTDRLRLTVGGRYTKEKKDFHIDVLDPTQAAPYPTLFRCPDPTLPADVPGLAPCRNPTVEFSKFTPRVGIDFRATPDLMYYAMWSRGFRSGGWDGRATSVTSIGPYLPETVDSYEIGLRSEFLDHRVRVNLTAFDAEYKNKQEEVLQPSPINPLVSETTVQNAASARISGLELETVFAPTQALRITSAIGYLNAKYLDFKQYDETTATDVDVKNTRNFRYAPRYTASVGGDWIVQAPSLSGKFIIGANLKWTDSFTTNPVKDMTGLQRDVIAARAMLDPSVTYQHDASERGTLKVSAFGKDVTHAGGYLYRTLDAGPFWFGDVAPGRTWGIDVQYQY